ncbi:MAG: PHP domain-containing protein [Candidatus Ornithomonoglobus sp.]
MMNINGFTKTGNWYRGNLHCHTTNSDGTLTPAQVADLYKKNGYSFLALSDHDIYTDYRAELDTEDFIIIPAIEASAVLYKEKGSNDRLAVHHIHGILGTEEMQKNATAGLFENMKKLPVVKFYGSWNGAKAAQELENTLKAHGCITIYNHPVWSRVEEKDFIDIEGITALEIYNYGTEIESGTGFDFIHWDVMLRGGKRVFASASDDNHNEEKLDDSFGGYIVVKADELSHESIVQSIIKGNYYSSSGPEIYDWGIKDDVAYVECSPAQRVNFIAGNLINAGTTVLPKKGEALTRAEFKLKGNESYIRVECIDEHGKIAWSNPLFIS